MSKPKKKKPRVDDETLALLDPDEREPEPKSKPGRSDGLDRLVRGTGGWDWERDIRASGK